MQQSIIIHYMIKIVRIPVGIFSKSRLENEWMDDNERFQLIRQYVYKKLSYKYKKMVHC